MPCGSTVAMANGAAITRDDGLRESSLRPHAARPSTPSFRRRPEPRGLGGALRLRSRVNECRPLPPWVPAFAGMTKKMAEEVAIRTLSCERALVTGSDRMPIL